MVAQILAHTRQFMLHGDAMGQDISGITDSGKLQELRRVDDAAREYDVSACRQEFAAAFAPIFDPDSPA